MQDQKLQTLNRQLQILDDLWTGNAIGKTKYNKIKKAIEKKLNQLKKAGA